MSLSFVKSAVLSSTDGISHNEETIIDNKETQSVRASGGGGHKPLFEQLRANKDAENERDEEYQKSLRGMRPLDEEDCAHLDAVERRRMEQEQSVKSGVEWEVAMFRAAKKDRELVQTVVEEGEKEGGNDENIASVAEEGVMEEYAAMASKKTSGGTSQPIAANRDSMTRIVPKFTIKKKRKRVSQESGVCADDGAIPNADVSKMNDEDSCNVKKECITGAEAGITDEGRTATSMATIKNAEDEKEDGGGLLGLGFYGSDTFGFASS
ncbi:hypothetical protein ACHAWU_002018 [Discostella pseudostelligera]|uniref:FAM192A/Fyv6 N-terminal domain-containing protein n=1 Tax=Discostella pseudostelligera TaxID=259834 RepID=A0ABD3MH50_9STRA